MRYDYHVHSNYSDGSFIDAMCEAAATAGLSGVGFADHCNVSEDTPAIEWKQRMGFNLDLTYHRRRDGIATVRDRYDIDVFDAVEMDYQPCDESSIRSFLEEASFDYAIGSVHSLEGTNIHDQSYFAEKSRMERQRLVDNYFEKLVALADSELFEIAAHPDLIERNQALRGHATSDHYNQVAAAFSKSRTLIELNAGRVLADYGEFHPSPPFLTRLLDHGVDVVLGTDSHAPEEIHPRRERLQAAVAEWDFTPATLDLD